jgi:succinate-semialdehyde dehydrogenase/glutarate-semialdehyde dehydrogenase
MKAINPATGAVMAEYPETSRAEVEERLDRAACAFPAWRDAGVAARGECLLHAATGLRAGRDRFARLLTTEMGKPIAAAEAEVEKCAWVCEHFATHGAALLAPERIATDATASEIHYEPLGPLLAVMPWNFPFWQVFRAAAPALIAGNVLVLKHASNVPGAALAIEEIFHAAGAPAGVFTTLLLPAAEAEALVEHPAIRAVTVTGSEAAGRALAARAGAAIKKIVLELGGSDPFIVLADADLDGVVPRAVLGRMQNNGQSCIAAKRFIVEEPVASEFERRFAAALAALEVGDPLDRGNDVGPLAREDLRESLDRQVRESVVRGARLLTGGRRLPGAGFYYAPTALAGVTPGMPAFDEETFGPLAAIARAGDASEAVALANRSRFGLGASVWTSDARRAAPLIAAIEAGSVFVNGIVKSDPRLPFGGIKASGFGRELSAAGLREFVNQKTVWIA